MEAVVASPDNSAQGLTRSAVAAARYDGAIHDPREITGLLHTMMPDRVRVLDVGCGTGDITRIVNAGHDNEVVGVEPDPARAEIARSRGLVVHNGLLEGRLQASLGLFDVVMATDVLEHTAAPFEFLGALRASLKPGGILLLSVPNVAHWSVRLMLLRGRFDYDATGIMDATHLRWFTAESLRELLATQEFDVIELRHSVGTWVPGNLNAPLKYLPAGVRRKLLIAGTSLRPTLFGVQHVVKARLRGGA